MEKDYSLLEAKLPINQRDDGHQRRPKRSNHAMAAVLLFFVATFWYTTIGPAFTVDHGSCTHKLTVEQRAARILKKHPLVG
jgi:membrane dipeptidase